MTLLVGIRCQDGIVLGSDGAATYGSVSLLEVEGKTISLATSKLEVYGERVVLGVSGAVGMGQSFHRTVGGYIADQYDRRKTWKSIEEAKKWLRDNLWPHVQPGFDHARELAAKVPAEYRVSVFSSVHTSSLVAFPIGDEYHLLELDHLCQSMECTDKASFVSVGSGQIHADPFLAFIKRVFWKSNQPFLQDGVFATLWTLQHAISISPGGVGGPIEIVTLENADGKGWKARKLSSEELGAHGEAIAAVEGDMPQLLGKFFKGRSPSSPPK
jgi:20S proteasome alpha/beta subunit